MDNVEIIIPNYNGAELIRKFLPSVIEHSENAIITIVDDKSKDDSIDVIKAEYPDINLIEKPTNTGFSETVNVGINQSNAEYILLLNTDVEIVVPIIKTLIDTISQDDVFSVCPSIIRPLFNNHDESNQKFIWHHGMFFNDCKPTPKETSEILFSTACCALYKKEMLDKLFGFEKIFLPYYFEDSDLGYRAWKRGWKSLVNPKVYVHHLHSQTISKNPMRKKDRVVSRNRLFFIWKNFEDKKMQLQQRLYMPLVLMKWKIVKKYNFILGYKDAIARKYEALELLERDKTYRVLSDKDIISRVSFKK
ncbi:MAG: glycosyltransferase [Armatimonadota bacterium]